MRTCWPATGGAARGAASPVVSAGSSACPTAPSAARASDRSPPSSPVDSPGPRRRPVLGLSGERVGLLLESADDPIDLGASLTKLLVQPIVQPSPENGLALGEARFALEQARAFVGEPAPVGVESPLLPGDRGQLLVESGEVCRQLRLAAGPPGLGVGDDVGRQPEPLGDFERQAPARRAIDQPVGRRVGVRVESEARRAHAVGRGCVRLQRIVVGRGDDGGATAAEVVDHGGAQRAAFDGIGPAAELVEQHERRQLERALHGDDVSDVRRERTQAGGNRLVVANVGEHGSERRERAAVVDGNEQSGLRHHGEQAEGLQGDGLPAGVRARDHERPRGRGNDEVRGDGLCRRCVRRARR